MTNIQGGDLIDDTKSNLKRYAKGREPKIKDKTKIPRQKQGPRASKRRKTGRQMWRPGALYIQRVAVKSRRSKSGTEVGSHKYTVS